MLREDRTTAETYYVAKATRRRRRILQAGFHLIIDEIEERNGN